MMHISTPGFIDPLISNLGQYSEETDGYAMGMTILIAHGCKPSTEEDLQMLECILEEPTSAPGHADAKAGWPEEVSLKLASLIKGLMGPRELKDRLRHREALAQMERLADEKQLRPGVDPSLAAAQAKECIICMAESRSVRFSCGHALCCADCADTLVQRNAKCPTCRAAITIASRGSHIATQETFKGRQSAQPAKLPAWDDFHA